MLRETAKRALRRAGRTRIGRNAIYAATMSDPRGAGLADADWPPSVAGFEDLAFLFTSGELNHGIASLAFDEAAYLYRIARRLDPATIVELGRFRGGSTLVLSTAMDEGAELHSYDPSRPDAALVHALGQYGLAGRVHLHVGDSRTAPAPPQPCALVFVDGDHSYAGARADYERWSRLLRPGGHLLFHDAAHAPGYRSFDEPVARLVAELETEDRALRRVGGVGSIVHFTRQ